MLDFREPIHGQLRLPVAILSNYYDLAGLTPMRM